LFAGLANLSITG